VHAVLCRHKLLPTRAKGATALCLFPSLPASGNLCFFLVRRKRGFSCAGISCFRPEEKRGLPTVLHRTKFERVADCLHCKAFGRPFFDPLPDGHRGYRRSTKATREQFFLFFITKLVNFKKVSISLDVFPRKLAGGVQSLQNCRGNSLHNARKPEQE